MSARIQLSHRGAAILTLLMPFIWVVIAVTVWRSVFNVRGVVAGYSWEELQTYLVLASGINALAGWRVAAEMMSTIRTGDVVFSLVRPVTFVGDQLSRACGNLAVDLPATVVACVILGSVMGVTPPTNVAALALFAAGVLLGYVTKVLLVFLFSLLAFWTIQGLGVSWAIQAFFLIASGVLVPYSLLPVGLGNILQFSPLAGVLSRPISVYLGRTPLGQGLADLAIQCAWVGLLWLLARRASRSALRTVTVQGG